MAVKYFLRDTNDDVTCDLGGLGKDVDMSRTMGADASPVSELTASITYEALFVFDVNVSSDTPVTSDMQISVDVVAATNLQYRFSVFEIDDGDCASDNSTVGSAQTGTGIKTETLNLTWGGAGNRLRLLIEGVRTTHGTKTLSINVSDADSFVNAVSFTEPAGGYVAQGLHHIEHGVAGFQHQGLQPIEAEVAA